MSEEQLTPEQQQGLQRQVRAVAEALASGRTGQQVTRDLVKQGWDQEGATQLVQQVATEVRQHQASPAVKVGIGLPSWALWIGILVLANVVSYLLDWPFWIF